MARKILLADDSVTAQNMGRKILVDAGYEVVTVNNGSAALKRVNESKPDLVVLDVYMPGYSGLEVCQRLKEASETAHIPVLLTVGKLEPFKPDEARRARADAHIVKPFEASELLSALAHLEDRIAASADQQKLNRKTLGDNGSARTVTSGSDTSWRERLRFPAKKKEKQETETEPADVTANFRDFRPSKAKTVSETPGTAKSANPGRESSPVPDIPRDITADELDALSAVAATLESTPPECIAPVAESQPAESLGAQSQPVQAPGTEVVNIASLTQEPAPIDRQDEPMFAVAPAAQEQVEVTATEAVAPGEPSTPAEPAEAKTEETQIANLRADEFPAEELTAQQFKAQESKLEEPPPEVAQVETPKTEETASAMAGQTGSVETAAAIVAEQSGFVDPASPAPTTVSLQEATEPEGPPPSDEELAQALRLLTPATGNAETLMPSHETLAAAGQLLAEEAARYAASQPHWIAEPVALTPEEASISLEAEMFGKFVTGAVVETTAPAAGQVLTVTGTIESSATEQAVLHPGSTADSTTKLVSQPVSELAPAPAIVEKEVETALETAVHGIAQEVNQNTSSTILPDEAQEQARSATFADVALPQEAELACVAEAMIEQPTVAEETTAQAELERAPEVEAAGAAGCADEAAHEDSSPDDGGQPDMGKHGKQTSGKSKGRQTSQPGTISEAPVVEAVMHAEPAPEAPKTMAAAASADGASTVVPDSSAIASIVESVLADLRPKIVEEITKKLARK